MRIAPWDAASVGQHHHRQECLTESAALKRRQLQLQGQRTKRAKYKRQGEFFCSAWHINEFMHAGLF